MSEDLGDLEKRRSDGARGGCISGAGTRTAIGGIEWQVIRELLATYWRAPRIGDGWTERRDRAVGGPVAAVADGEPGGDRIDPGKFADDERADVERNFGSIVWKHAAGRVRRGPRSESTDFGDRELVFGRRRQFDTSSLDAVRAAAFDSGRTGALARAEGRRLRWTSRRVAFREQRPGHSAPAQITVQVQAMDSQSFLDHSADIAMAVRQAMLESSVLNDVIREA